MAPAKFLAAEIPPKYSCQKARARARLPRMRLVHFWIASMSSDAQYWRALALERSILALRMKDPLAKAATIRLSNHYAELAKQAEGSMETKAKVVRLRPSFPEAAQVIADM
jgi:hypothetical protein